MALHVGVHKNIHPNLRAAWLDRFLREFMCKMTNALSIKSDSWPDVTEKLHFAIDIKYEGCRLFHEDIYFDDESVVVSGLQRLNESRSGKVTVDGGERFGLAVEATRSGGLILKFKAASDSRFPGRLDLEGFFSVEGEYFESTVKALARIFQRGGEFAVTSDNKVTSLDSP